MVPHCAGSPQPLFFLFFHLHVGANIRNARGLNYRNARMGALVRSLRRVTYLVPRNVQTKNNTQKCSNRKT